MTHADGPEEPIVGAPQEPDRALSPRVPPVSAHGDEEEQEEHPVIAWARAIAGGIKDTAKQMVDEGRRSANEAYDEGWRRFDDKTRYRRRGR